MKIICLMLLLIVTCQVSAGDYMLFIADRDNKSKCAAQKYWAVKTSKELANAFEQYFSGKQPDIGILQTAFANGHYHFCGRKEIKTVLDTLYKIKADGPKEHSDHLVDFIGKIKAIN